MSAAAADGDTERIRRDVSHALRSSASAVVPAACALLALAQPVMALVFGYGRTNTAATTAMAGILMAFSPGLIALSGQYVLSRTFYALSDTRTPFLLNLVIAGLNAGLSTTAYLLLPARWAVTGMAGAYSLALCTGWAITAYVLNRRLAQPRGSVSESEQGRGPEAHAGGLWRSAAVGAYARLLAAAVPAGGLGHLAARSVAPLGAATATVVGGLVIALAFALLSRPLRLNELDALLATARRRLLWR